MLRSVPQGPLIFGRVLSGRHQIGFKADALEASLNAAGANGAFSVHGAAPGFADIRYDRRQLATILPCAIGLGGLDTGGAWRGVTHMCIQCSVLLFNNVMLDRQ